MFLVAVRATFIQVSPCKSGWRGHLHVGDLLDRFARKTAACLSWTSSANLPLSFVERIYQTYARATRRHRAPQPGRQSLVHSWWLGHGDCLQIASEAIHLQKARGMCHNLPSNVGRKFRFGCENYCSPRDYANICQMNKISSASRRSTNRGNPSPKSKPTWPTDALHGRIAHCGIFLHARCGAK